MEPLIKSFLKNHTFQQLEDEHGVCIRFSTDGTKFSANYDQILAKNGDQLMEQCRGMVVRPLRFDKQRFGDGWKDVVVGDVEILAWPMNRFYNHGDPAAAQIDWSDGGLRVYEKLDGTMIVLYWDALVSKWCAGTRSVPNADLPILVGHIEIGDDTFSDLFWKALWQTAAQLGAHVPAVAPSAYEACKNVLDSLDKDLTYVFELTSPWNRVVVKYNVPRVTLLSARNTKSGHEVHIEHVHLEFVNRPKTWDLHDPFALAAFIDNANPAELEGAVVCDSHFRRLKIKNKAWVMSSRAKDMVSTSPRSALECIILEKLDDVIPLVEKDIGDKMLTMQQDYLRYCVQIDKNVVAFKEDANHVANPRKRYAELVMLTGGWTAPYFQLWENRAPDARTLLRNMLESGKLHANSLDTILDGMRR